MNLWFRGEGFGSNIRKHGSNLGEGISNFFAQNEVKSLLKSIIYTASSSMNVWSTGTGFDG